MEHPGVSTKSINSCINHLKTKRKLLYL